MKRSMLGLLALIGFNTFAAEGTQFDWGLCCADCTGTMGQNQA